MPDSMLATKIGVP